VLEKKDYEKARELFQEVIQDEPDDPGAHFGLVVIYADKESPYFDIIKAKKHADLAEEHLNTILPDEEEVIQEYFMNTQERPTRRSVEKKITLAIEEVEANLIKYVREENNLELAGQVIEKFPDFRHYENVVHIRNHLEFRKAEKTNTIQAYNDFINAYPDAAQVPEAIKQINELAYVQAAKKNTVEAYQQYINEYPEAEKVNKAIIQRNKLAFENAKNQNTLDALQSFIEQYPDALEVPAARNIQKKLVYQKARKIRTLEAYNEFIKQYPEGEMYIDIFNLKANDLGEQYLGDHLGISANVEFARVFDNNEMVDHTGATAYKNNGEIVLVGNTQQSDTTRFTDPWVLGLNQQGKMDWNKIIRYPYSDWVNDVEINSRNEIYCAGITNWVNDTIPGSAWLFKLDASGKKIWNRTLGLQSTVGFEINDQDMLIFTGDYISPDTIRQHYVLKVDGEGKKRWKRSYAGNFSARDINMGDNQEMIIVTDQWVYGLDQQGYITWEKQFDTTFIAEKGAVDPTGQLNYVAGINSNNEIVLYAFNRQSEMVWHKNMGKSSGFTVHDLELVGDNILLAASFQNNNELVLLNNQGNIIKSWDILNNGRMEQVRITPDDNNALVTTANGNVVLLKMKQ
jgi:TolA-binding protein